MTRSIDQDVDLYARSGLANTLGADLFPDAVPGAGGGEGEDQQQAQGQEEGIQAFH